MIILVVLCYVGICSISVQVPFLFVSKLEDVALPASSNASVTLNCIAKFSQQRPPSYGWRKDGKDLAGSSSSITVTYSKAIDIHNNYYCVKKSLPSREVQCSATYQCTASLPGLQVKNDTKANVTVILSEYM